MSWSIPRTRIRVFINNVLIATTSDVSITESLDSLCRTAEFNIAAQPTTQPDEGDTILIQFIDVRNALSYDIFGGTINSMEVESEPWGFSILCCDQLEKLRATNKSGDRILSGLTEGGAWKAVANYCGVHYDSADISDSGYILGAQEDVSWLDDSSTAGNAIIQELDNVFGMVTMTIGNNRVIRVPVDFTPNDDVGLYRTYTKHDTKSFGGHHKSRGNRDSIQNVQRVTGAAIESSDGSCTATPWAYAISGNAQLGSRVRTSEQSFSSDFIQDTSLASAIVRRLMRQTNRSPNKSSLTLANEPNLHPAHKVKLIDETYGINAKLEHLCLVTNVSRTGLTMTADLDCGPAGSWGSVTSGVDQVCGDDHTNVPIDDDFTPLEPLYPPLDLGDAITDEDLALIEGSSAIPRTRITKIEAEGVSVTPESRAWGCGSDSLTEYTAWTVTADHIYQGAPLNDE